MQETNSIHDLTYRLGLGAKVMLQGLSKWQHTYLYHASEVLSFAKLCLCLCLLFSLPSCWF